MKNYGFTHQLDGRQFSFVVAATSEDEARAKATSVSGAEFVGSLLEDKVEPARIANDREHSDRVVMRLGAQSVGGLTGGP